MKQPKILSSPVIRTALFIFAGLFLTQNGHKKPLLQDVINKAAIERYVSEPAIAPVDHTHAHNDYEHKHPLFDALRNGFVSLESDIYQGGDNDLYVAHMPWQIRDDRTLASLYLEPLKQIVAQNGSVYRGSQKSLILLIDVKSLGDEVHEILQKQLEDYKDILTSYDEHGNKTERAVTVLKTGYRPSSDYKHKKTSYYEYEGRFSDKIGYGVCDGLNAPVVSGKWSDELEWDGKGQFPADQKKKLRNIVLRFHKNSKEVRLWDIPDKEIVWKEVRDAGVDFINTDRLPELHYYLTKQNSPVIK